MISDGWFEVTLNKTYLELLKAKGMKIAIIMCLNIFSQMRLFQKDCHPRRLLSGIQSFQPVKIWIPA